MKGIPLLLVMSALLNNIECGKIMVYTPYCSKSMMMLIKPVAEAMEARGHEVWIVTTWEYNPGSKKNIKVSVCRVGVSNGIYVFIYL